MNQNYESTNFPSVEIFKSLPTLKSFNNLRYLYKVVEYERVTFLLEYMCPFFGAPESQFHLSSISKGKIVDNEKSNFKLDSSIGFECHNVEGPAYIALDFTNKISRVSHVIFGEFLREEQFTEHPLVIEYNKKRSLTKKISSL